MEEKIAREYLTAPEGRKLSEVGEAVDILYQKYRSYKAIAQQVGDVSDKFLSSRHRIFQLPTGIQWKVDQGEIGITHSYEISRLENEDDQWLLALAISEQKLTPDECKNIVNRVSDQSVSIGEVLSVSTGIRFDETKPLILPIPPELWISMSRAAWNQGKNWEDLCYHFIRQGIVFSIGGIEGEVETIESCVREIREKMKRMKDL